MIAVADIHAPRIQDEFTRAPPLAQEARLYVPLPQGWQRSPGRANAGDAAPRVGSRVLMDMAGEAGTQIGNLGRIGSLF